MIESHMMLNEMNTATDRMIKLNKELNNLAGVSRYTLTRDERVEAAKREMNDRLKNK